MGKAKELAELANNLTVSGGAVTVSGFNYDNIVDSAPGALNTLNELAAAIGDDANFSTTVTNSIATKLPLAGGTLTGDLAINSDGQSTGGANLQITNTNTSNNYPKAITAFMTSMGVGKRHQILIGKDGSTNDTGSLAFYYAGDASANNAVVLGLWGSGDTLAITGAGNVGIGTIAPGKKLHIRDSVPDIRLEDTDTNAVVDLKGNTGTGSFVISTDVNNALANSKIIFEVDNDEKVRIDNNGNVGIGTTTPTSYANSQKTLVIEDDTSPAIAWSDTGQSKDWFAVAMGSGLYFNYADGGGSSTASNVTSVLELGNTGAVAINGSGFYLKQDSSKSTIRSETQPIVLQTYGNSAWQDNVKISNHTSEPILNVTGAGYGYTHGAMALKSDTGYDARVRGQGIYLFNEENDTTWYAGTPYLNTSAGSRPFDFNFQSGTTSLSTITATGTGTYTAARIHASGVISTPAGIELGSGVDATAANTLDDYEEGYWDPVLSWHTPSNGSVSYIARTAFYVKVGRMVTVHCEMRLNIVSQNSASLPLLVSGFPFNFRNTGGYGGSLMQVSLQGFSFNSGHIPFGWGEYNSDRMFLFTMASGAANTNLPTPPNYKTINVSGTYITPT